MKAVLRFFFQPDAFTFRGLLTFALQMLGLYGALLGAGFLLRQPTVEVTNVDPVALIDMRAFKEGFTARQVNPPEQLMRALYALGESEPNDSPTIFCWYHPARSPERETEARAGARKVQRPIDFTGPPTDASYIEGMRRHLAVAARPPTMSNAIDANAMGIFSNLDELFGGRNGEIDWWHLVRDPFPGQPKHDRAAWAGLSIRNVVSGSVLRTIESANLNEKQLMAALEALHGEMWVLSRIRVRNASTHAAVDRVAIEIDHSGNGLIEHLGGSLPIERIGRSLYAARIDKLLPGESRVALFRTRRWGISQEGLRSYSDPTSFFDPTLGRRFILPIAAVALIWLAVNALGRSRWAALLQEHAARRE
jgi:hypothetical protein